MNPVIKIFPVLDTNEAFKKQFIEELESRIQLTSIYQQLEKQPHLLISRLGTRSSDGLDEHFKKILPEHNKDRHDIFLFIQNATPPSTVDIPNYTLKKVAEVAWSKDKLKEGENKDMFDNLALDLFKNYGYKFQVTQSLKDQTLKIGQEMKLEMKVAFPLECDSTWLKDGKPVDKERYSTLQNKESYTLSVKEAAMKDVGNYTLKIGNVLESSFILIRDPPGPPKNLRIGSSEKHILDLQWDEPSISSESQIRAYIIERTDKDDNWTEMACIKDTCYPVFGFKEGVQFRVKAVNDSGMGEACHKTKLHLYSPPDSPMDLNVQQLDRFSYQLEWKEPQEGSEVLGYFIQRKVNGDWCKIGCSEGTTSTVYIERCPENVELRVTAVNKFGLGKPGNPVKVQVKARPGAPSDLRVTNRGRDSCTLKWDYKGSNNGTVPREYVIEMETSSSAWTTKGRVHTTEGTVYGLKEVKNVKFQVRAVNEFGLSKHSDPIDLFTSPEYEERILKAVVNPRLAKKKTCCSWIFTLLWHIVWFLTCGFCRRSLVPITKEKLRKELDKIERGETSLEEEINDKFELYPGQLQEMIRRKLDEPYTPVSRSERSRLLP